MADLEPRVADLEHQLLMFERMLLMLSGTLDQHFKKYDELIVSQQQQITELNAVISTLLNDQYKHSEAMREKLSSVLHGISATSASLDTMINAAPRFPTTSVSSQNMVHQPNVNNHNDRSAADNILGDIIDSNNNNSNSITSNKQDVENSNEQHRTRIQNDNSPTNYTDTTFVPSPFDAFNHANTYTGNHHNGEENTHSPISNTNVLQSSGSDISTYNIAQATHEQSINHSPLNTNGNAIPGKKNSIGGTDPQRTRKRNKNSYTGEIKFVKSPHSVIDVWKEYSEGIDGKPSIRELEELYQNGWRRDPAINKKFTRRRVLYRSIEKGLERGYTLNYIIDLLEESRIIDQEKGLKQPIGWLFHNANIPNILK